MKCGPVSEAALNNTNPGHWCNTRPTDDATAPNFSLSPCPQRKTSPSHGVKHYRLGTAAKKPTRKALAQIRHRAYPSHD